MAVEIANVVNAMGSILGNGVELGGPAGGVVSRTGAGVYRLVLGQPLGAGEYTAAITPKGAVRFSATIDDVSDTEKTIRTFDGAGAAADVAFTWTIFQLPGT